MSSSAIVAWNWMGEAKKATSTLKKTKQYGALKKTKQYGANVNFITVYW